VLHLVTLFHAFSTGKGHLAGDIAAGSGGSAASNLVESKLKPCDTKCPLTVTGRGLPLHSTALCFQAASSPPLHPLRHRKFASAGKQGLSQRGCLHHGDRQRVRVTYKTPDWRVQVVVHAQRMGGGRLVISCVVESIQGLTSCPSRGPRTPEARSA
jgi:hypothetical protein